MKTFPSACPLSSGLQGSGGIPLTRKICYAVGGVPNQVTTAAMAASLQIFLLDVVQVEYILQRNLLPVLTFKLKYIPQIEAFYVALILFASRAWDAVSDPLIGYLVGRSSWTRIGKLTPWLVGGALKKLNKSRMPDAGVPLSRCLCRRLVLSTPFGVLSYVLLWFGPPGPAGFSVPWFLVTTCLFETLMSVNQ